MLFLTCSQVWQLGSSQPNFTLEGHEKGLNCVDYFQGGDKPYLISGADDRWVYPSNVECVLSIHVQWVLCIEYYVLGYATWGSIASCSIA